MFLLYTSKFNNLSIHQPFSPNHFLDGINYSATGDDLSMREPKLLSFNCVKKNSKNTDYNNTLIVVFYKILSTVRYSIYFFSSFGNFRQLSNANLDFGTKYTLNISRELTFSRDSANCGTILMSDSDGNVIFFQFNGTSISLKQVFLTSRQDIMATVSLTERGQVGSKMTGVEVYSDSTRHCLFGQIYLYSPFPNRVGEPFLIANFSNQGASLDARIDDHSVVSFIGSSGVEGLVYYSASSVIHAVYFAQQQGSVITSPDRAIGVGRKVSASILTTAMNVSFVFQVSQGNYLFILLYVVNFSYLDSFCYNSHAHNTANLRLCTQTPISTKNVLTYNFATADQLKAHLSHQKDNYLITSCHKDIAHGAYDQGKTLRFRLYLFYFYFYLLAP
jgi:hypothetical protein